MEYRLTKMETDFDLLNDGQKAAFRPMWDYALGKTDYRYFVLEGWAGTGKTFLTSMFAQWLLHKKACKRLAICAPVGKAVKVLSNTLNFESEDMVLGTLHSLFALRPQINTTTGEQEFKPDPTTIAEISYCDFLICDEASMIASELFEHIERRVNMGKLKVLFVGDGGQAPPIGEKQAIPYDSAKRELYKMGFYELKEIVRQGADNPIIPFTSNLRKRVHSPSIILNTDTSINEGTCKGVQWVNDSKVLKALIKDLFTSPAFNENPDHAKIICWRNETVDNLNRVVRNFRFGKGIGKIVNGEKMVTAGIVKNREGVIMLSNSTEFEVLQFTETAVEWQEKEFKAYCCRIQASDLTTHTIYVVHEESEEMYNGTLEMVAKEANRETNRLNRAAMWQHFWELRELFADVNYNYAITTHRSQGSTYKYALVIIEDYLGRTKEVYERNRLIYTACTRPSNVLYMVGNI